MDMLLNTYLYEKIILTLVASLFVPFITFCLKSVGNYICSKFNKHYICKKPFLNLFQTIFSAFYIVIMPISCTILYFIIFIFIASLVNFFPFGLLIIKFMSDYNFVFLSSIILSLLIEYKIYKNKKFSKFNIKKGFRLLYTLLPTAILVLAWFPHSIIINIIVGILFFINLPTMLALQPRTNLVIYNKMDITLKNGTCYKDLDTKKVCFSKNACIIEIFYKYSPEILKETISIPLNNIISKRYHDSEYKIDSYYDFINKFLFFLLEQ